MRRLGAVIAGAVLAAGISACAAFLPHAECVAHGGSVWRQLVSQHFFLVTDANSETALATIAGFEKIRSGLLCAWGGRLDPPGRINVVLLRNRSEWAEFADGRYRGLVAFGLPQPVILLAGQVAFGDGAPQLNVIAHELSHYMMAYVVARPPRWIAEGMAQLLETVSLADADNTVVIGRPKPEALHWVQMQGMPLQWMRNVLFLPLQTLWEWTNDDVPQDRLDALYASSWAWSHFLFNRHRDRLDSFWQRLADGQEPRQAWGETFAGPSGAELGQQLAGYLDGGQYAALKFKAEIGATPAAERELRPAEVHVLRARLFALGLGRNRADDAIARATEDLQQALALDPDNLEAAGLHIEARGQTSAAREQALALVKAHLDSAAAWSALLASGCPAQSEAGIWAGIERVKAATTRDAELAFRLARCYLAGQRYADAERVAAQAAQLAPWFPNILSTYAAAAASNGHCELGGEQARRVRQEMIQHFSQPAREQIAADLAAYETLCGQR